MIRVDTNNACTQTFVSELIKNGWKWEHLRDLKSVSLNGESTKVFIVPHDIVEYLIFVTLDPNKSRSREVLFELCNCLHMDEVTSPVPVCLFVGQGGIFLLHVTDAPPFFPFQGTVLMGNWDNTGDTFEAFDALSLYGFPVSEVAFHTRTRLLSSCVAWMSSGRVAMKLHVAPAEFDSVIMENSLVGVLSDTSKCLLSLN